VEEVSLVRWKEGGGGGEPSEVEGMGGKGVEEVSLVRWREEGERGGGRGLRQGRVVKGEGERSKGRWGEVNMGQEVVVCLRVERIERGRRRAWGGERGWKL